MRICGVGCRWGPSVPVGTTSAGPRTVTVVSCSGADVRHRATAYQHGCTADSKLARSISSISSISSIQNPIAKARHGAESDACTTRHGVTAAVGVYPLYGSNYGDPT